MSDTIFLDDPHDLPPHEPASDPKYIKHVSCNGARFHVKSYSLHETYKGSRAITRCSEPKCIVNKRAAEALAEIAV